MPVAALALLLALAAPGRRAAATCRCDAGDLEVVLVLDTTSSMHVMIGTVKEQLYRLMAALEGGAERLRLGAVLYRTPEADGYVVKTLPLTEDRQAVAAWIREARAQGGGYEAVEKGLEAAVEQMEWSKGARKVILLVGDEGPHPDNREKCLQLARLAASRGIAVHAVTCSLTAWSYWQLANPEEWKALYARQGEKAKEEFQLPVFKEIAAAGKGLSVSGKDTRELLKWLLVLAAGEADPEKVDLDRVLAWQAASAAAPAGRAPMLAQLRHGGEWETPRNFEALRAALGRKVRLEFDSAREAVAATDRKLAERPLLYLCGHTRIVLSAPEKEGLRRYLEGGGTLWADCCCARREFDESLRALLVELFPRGRLEALPAEHPLWRSGYEIGKVRRADRPRKRDTAFSEAAPRLEGLKLGGRLAVIYSPTSLGCGWAAYPLGRPCQLHDEDALKLSINILLYALTRPE